MIGLLVEVVLRTFRIMWLKVLNVSLVGRLETLSSFTGEALARLHDFTLRVLCCLLAGSAVFPIKF